MGKRLAMLVLGAAVLCAAPSTTTTAADTITFAGVVSDDNCDKGDHSRMKMGDTDAECTNACVSAHGARYVLFDGKTAYILSDFKTLEKFAGQNVKVVGTLDSKTKTITIESMAPRR